MASTVKEKDNVCPSTLTFNRFAYIRKNINKKNVSYECKFKRRISGICNAKLQFNRCAITGIVDFENKIPVGQHLRLCYSLNGMKSPSVDDDEDQKDMHNDKRIRVTDV